jgi:UDPglucose 6-dehydrogenase
VRVAILGMGPVGQAQKVLFGRHKLVTYDPVTDDERPDAEIAGCDFAVVAVGTPASHGGHADMSYVRDAVASVPVGLPVLVRSTTPPGSMSWIAASRTGPTCHCAEYLHERPGGGWSKSSDVPFVILGGMAEHRRWFLPVLRDVYPLRDIRQCELTESEMAKYAANLYWANRVTFVNELAGICAKFGVSWENVRAAWLADPRVHPSYTRMGNFPPGFGGRCWPKDLQALIAAAREAGYQPEFLEAIQDSNDRFTHPEEPDGALRD